MLKFESLIFFLEFVRFSLYVSKLKGILYNQYTFLGIFGDLFLSDIVSGINYLDLILDPVIYELASRTWF